jgi:hypothetical protein
MKKEYKKGMADGAKPFSEKFEKQGSDYQRENDLEKEGINKVLNVLMPLVDDMSSIQKKNLYDLNTQCDLSKDLKVEEKEFLLTGLYTLSQICENVTPHQQSFLRSVQAYLDIDNPQTTVELAKIENFEKVAIQKAIMQTFMEFLFLEQEDDSFLKRYVDVFKHFNVNESAREEILQRINNVYRATGAQGLAEKYGYIPESSPAELAEQLAGAHVEMTDLTIDTILHIAPGEEKVFSNQNIILNAYIHCEGTLLLECCVLTYKQNSQAGRIVLEETASLAMRNCEVICEVPDEKTDDRSNAESFFLNIKSKASASFHDTEFRHCAHFLNAEYESVIIFEACKIITPSSRFYESWRSNLEMQKCNIQFIGSPISPSSSVFQSGGNTTGIHVADCLIEGQKNGTDRKEESCLFGLDHAVFRLNGAEYENCSFVRIDSCIAQAKKVSKCEFRECEHAIDCSSLDSGSSITDCLFSECEDVIRNLPPSSSVAYCQFCNCKNSLIRNVDSGCGGGISIKYCDFYNLIRDTGRNLLFGSQACLHLVRSNKGDPSSVKNCIFDGVNLIKGFLISGSVENKKHIAVSVDDCEFRKCKTQEPSGEIIESNCDCMMAGIFGKLMTVKVINTSKCRGLDTVNKDDCVSDPFEVKRATAAGAKIGVTELATFATGISGHLASAAERMREETIVMAQDIKDRVIKYTGSRGKT